jgi:hypothetical protein
VPKSVAGNGRRHPRFRLRSHVAGRFSGNKLFGLVVADQSGARSIKLHNKVFVHAVDGLTDRGLATFASAVSIVRIVAVEKVIAVAQIVLQPRSRVDECNEIHQRNVPRPSTLRLPSLRPVQRHGRTDQRLEGILIQILALMDIDRAPGVALEARVEQTGRVLQRGALGES